AGVNVVAQIDTRPDAEIVPQLTGYRGAAVVDTQGRNGLRKIRIRQGARTRWIDADCLAVSGGWNPTLHLSGHMGAAPVWNDSIAAFVPRPGAVPGLDVAGAAAGVFTTKACIKSGIYRAKLMLEDLGFKAPSMRGPKADDTPYVLSPYWAVPGAGRAWVDFQNDVTVKDIALASRENFRSVEHMKRYTTQGMATDQGKNSNVVALAVLAQQSAQSIPETGTTTFRPPFSPVSIAAMGAGARGKGFAPERFMSSHKASLERGAAMIEAGLWYRPSVFTRPGETTWRQSCDREINMVRQCVGVCDVSTLGKIDIQGRDAAKLLDLVYTNTFSSLKTGRVRYGLMLREDGYVMDDGTCARLGQNHFVMTTTTAAAGPVMQHLEFVHQCLRPDWDVQMISVTEQWAQIAVAGPKSRAALNAVLDTQLSDADFPFMACGRVRV
ncbi:MAG: sarcosine oxidase subunit alpha, partial [Paracoccaceae bacterium]